jgi:hypothetical protein
MVKGVIGSLLRATTAAMILENVPGGLHEQTGAKQEMKGLGDGVSVQWWTMTRYRQLLF